MNACGFVATLVIAGMLWVTGAAAMPAPFGDASEQSLLCRSAIQRVDPGSGLPPHMLSAIGRVESGRIDPVTGHVHPWPWTVNAEGQGRFFDTKSQAIAFVAQLQARGVRSIDVGCLQVNLMYHPSAFRDLEEAFDPVMNARYAVKFLNELRDKTGHWEDASAWYHSADPREGGPYREKVVAAMADEARGEATYATLSDHPAGIWPTPVMSMPGMLAGQGNIIRLPGNGGRIMLAQSNAMVSGVGGSVVPASAAVGISGRGLGSYRLQPVRTPMPRVISLQ